MIFKKYLNLCHQVMISSCEKMLHFHSRERREAEQREKERIDKERREREIRERERREREFRERQQHAQAQLAAQLQAAQAAHSQHQHQQHQQQQQKAAAAEAVEDHFRMSMELAKKVSWPDFSHAHHDRLLAMSRIKGLNNFLAILRFFQFRSILWHFG